MREVSSGPALGRTRTRSDRTSRLRLALCGLTAMTPLLIVSTARADEAAPDTGAVAAAISEIVVTARHRAEDSQKVPAALAVVGGEFLEKTNTTNISQLSQYVPSIQFTFFNARNANINIRGLGNNIGLANDGLDPGVGFYVDQVYYSRPATATLDLVDIDHVEILRGPQGTLFGKDTTSGAINITTASPAFQPTGQAEVSGGNYGYVQAKASVSGPLIDDKLAGRLSVATTTREGYVTNVFDDNRVNNYRNFTVRGQLLYTPTDDFKIRVIADYANQFTHCCAQLLANIVTPANGKNFNAIARQFGYTPVIGTVDVNSRFQARQETGGTSVQMDWSLPKVVFTSITAWRFWNWWPANDADNSPVSVFLAGQNRDYQNQLSQEFRVASAGQNNVDYVAGLYLYREQIKAIGLTQYGSAASYYLLGPTVPAVVANNLTNNYTSNYKTDSIALFGQAVWHITPQLNLTGGLRYTTDFKSGNFTQVTSGAAPLTRALAALASARAALGTSTAFQLKNVNANISGLVNLSYQFTPDVLAYVNYARGYKSGGLNLAQLPPGANPIVAPESVDAVEGGVKLTLFDRRLTLNADVFWERDKNYQANIFDQNILKLYLSNVPEVRSQGFEADLQAQPTDNLSLYASLAYDDAIYADYPGGQCGLESTAAACDLSGRPLAGTPRWAVSAGGEYDYPVTLGALEAKAYVGADYSYRSSLYSHASDSIYTRLPQLTLVNARVGLKSDRWDVFFWAKNLANDTYYNYLQPGPGNTGAIYGLLGDPRTYGATLRVKY
jgi:iron complex outermembrane receptor protein